MMKLLPLENEVLAKFLDGDYPVLATLRKQFEQAKITERKFSGVGFFLDLAVDEALAIPNKPNFVLNDLGGDIAGVQHGVCFVLFIKNGLLDMLEGATYADPWPDNVSDFTVAYIKERKISSERDFEVLKKKLPAI